MPGRAMRPADGVTGPGTFQASRARYGRCWVGARRAACFGRQAVVPHTDGVTESRIGPRSKHQGETTMDQYAGIDVSLEYSSVCVVDASGKVVREAKVVSEPEGADRLVRFARA